MLARRFPGSTAEGGAPWHPPCRSRNDRCLLNAFGASNSGTISSSPSEIATRRKDMPLPVGFKGLATLEERQKALLSPPKRPAGKPSQSLRAL